MSTATLGATPLRGSSLADQERRPAGLVVLVTRPAVDGHRPAITRCRARRVRRSPPVGATPARLPSLTFRAAGSGFGIGAQRLSDRLPCTRFGSAPVAR